jgi:hypothetical protein
LPFPWPPFEDIKKSLRLSLRERSIEIGNPWKSAVAAVMIAKNTQNVHPFRMHPPTFAVLSQNGRHGGLLVNLK